MTGTRTLLGPAPGGAALTLSVECRVSPDTPSAKRHDVTIRPDWTVEVPHDLEAERVAFAFGGYLSCVALADRTIPALQAALPLLARSAQPALRTIDRNRWRPVNPSACCRRARYASIADATRHLRSADHLSVAHHAPRWQLDDVMAACAKLWGPFESRAPANNVSHLVIHSWHVDRLWQAGVHPDLLREMADASGLNEAMPIEYYLGFAYSGVNREWLEETLSHRPDSTTASTLVWLNEPDAKAPASVWGAWLDLGLRIRDVTTAVDAGLSPSVVRKLATTLGKDPSFVAQDLALWAKSGCRPTLQHLRLLYRQGDLMPIPVPRAVDELTAEVEQLLGYETGPYRYTDERTELAVMLAILGTRHDVLGFVRSGVRRAQDLPDDPWADRTGS